MANKEANLITNSEGAVYHLGLQPEDICPVIITAGDPDRVTLIARHLDYKDKEIRHREFHSVIGTLGSKRILILSTGIGPDNIDIVMTEIHALFLQAKSKGLIDISEIKFIRLGTSGSIHHDHPLDSILISTCAIGLDNLPSFYQTHHQHLQDKQGDLPYYKMDAPGELCKSFTDMPTAKAGITLTSPGFYGPQFRTLHMNPVWNLDHIKKHFKKKYIELSSIEMETATIYFFAHELGHQAVSINALIADRLANRFSENSAQVISDMIREAMQVIEGLVF